MNRRRLAVAVLLAGFLAGNVSSAGAPDSVVDAPKASTSTFPLSGPGIPDYDPAAPRNVRLRSILGSPKGPSSIPTLRQAEADPDIEVRVGANSLRARWGDIEAAVPLRKDFELLSRMLLCSGRQDDGRKTMGDATSCRALQLWASCANGLAQMGDFLGYETAVSWVLPNETSSQIADHFLSAILSAADTPAVQQAEASVEPVALLRALAESETQSEWFFRVFLYGSDLASEGIPDVLEVIASRCDPPLEDMQTSDREMILRRLKRNGLSTTNFENALKRQEEKNNSLSQQEPQGLMDIGVKRIPLGVVRKEETVKETLSFRVEEGATVELSTPDGTPEMAIALEPVESDKTQYRVNVTWTPKESGHLANVLIVVKATKGDVVDERRILCLGLVARDSAPAWSFERIMTDDTREWWDLDKLK